MATHVSDEEGPAIGIDLGTTNSCVAVYQNGMTKVIANEHGNRITQSVVSFSDGGIIVGHDAFSRATLDPINTVYECKRLMGRAYDDHKLVKDIRSWPFTVINDNGKPKIQVTHKKQTKTFHPQEISAMILEKMKGIAENYLKKRVTKAVITVPAYFNETQRRATKDAAQIAGLEVLRIINEPTAAAMAYGLREKARDGEKRVLVFDLGGGTFDVSILIIDEGIFRVLATDGDTHLGGADFDNRLVDKIINVFNKKYARDEEVTTNVRKREYHRLRKACEQSKCELSEYDFAKVRVEYFHEGQDLDYDMEKAEFEKINSDLFDKVIHLVKSTLVEARLSAEEIDHVLLVGGSSRIPMIRDKIQSIFSPEKIDASINPDEVVACGAAIEAAILDGDDIEELEDVMLQDVTPLSLGVNLKGDVTLVVVKRNSLVPCRYTKTVTTSVDDQTRIDLGVYQGERTMTKDNHFLGDFYMDGIPPAPSSIPRIDIMFEIDADNCIEATAQDRHTKKKHTVNIDPNKAIISNTEISRLVEEAHQYRQEDRAEMDRVSTRSSLESLANWVRYISTQHATKLPMSSHHLQHVNEKASEIILWLHENYENPTETYRTQLQCLQKVCESTGFPSEYLIPGNLPGQTRTKLRQPSPSWLDNGEDDDYVPEVD